MRKLLYGIVALLVGAMALSACSSGADDPEQAAEGGSGSFPVTVEHKFGTTEIPAEPERVVTVGYTDSDYALAFDVVPVGVREFLGGYDWRSRPWAQDALNGEEPTPVGGDQINYEAVAAQRPDLILALNSGIDEAAFNRLSQIAPTVAQSGDFIDYGMPWRDQTELVGKALGKDDEAAELIESIESKFQDVGAENTSFEGATAILAYGGPDGYGAYSTQDTRSRFFTDLGFSMPKEIDELAGEEFFVQFSQEQFRLMDQDVVVMYGSQADIASNPVFSRLDAVGEDRVIYLDLEDQFAGALGYMSPLSIPFLIEEATPMLAAAVDGDAKTTIEQPQ